jgi:hypothetical protein
MTARWRWLGLGVGLLLVTLAAGLWGLQRWAGGENLRQRVEQAATAALGLPVRVGAVHVGLWPLPAVVVEQASVAARPAITLGRVEARPRWTALLAGRLELRTLVVRDAELSQAGVDMLLASLQKQEQTINKGRGLEPNFTQKTIAWPDRVLLRQVSWTSRRGARSTADIDAALGAGGWPDTVSLQVTAGQWTGAQAAVQRQGEADDWTLNAQVGGGTVNGTLGVRLPAQPGGAITVQGSFETRGVDVAALTAPARPLAGRLEASTTLTARAPSAGDLVDALQTRTGFTVRNAVLHGLDLVKAVQTVGLSRGGETRLDTLAGQLNTQGLAAQLQNLVASSGLMSVTGQVAVSPDRVLSGRLVVDATSGVAKSFAGVPLAVGGTLDAPTVMLTRGALLGAAIGTAVMPGVGTGAGASLGDRIGEGLKGLLGK